MPLLGVEGKVQRIAPTEEVDLNPQDFMQDFNYEMIDGSWIHLEFESDSIRTEVKVLRMKDRNADDIICKVERR